MEGWSFKALFSTLVLPPAGPLLLAVAGALLAARARGVWRRAGRWMLGAGLALTYALSTSFVSEALMGWAESGSGPPLTEEQVRALAGGRAAPGAIVVLGGGVRFNPNELPNPQWPNQRTLERLAHGAALARASGLPVLVSGGTPPRRDESEATVMARTLRRSFGVDALWVEDGSGDTAENARETARVLARDGVKRVVLVTQAYHMARARRAFEAVGLEVIAAPHGHYGGGAVESWGSFVPGPAAMALSWLATHELVGQLWYRLRGHLGPG
jgi:uncharacterized SAM-binding protein YcdF (DUF218 family)